MYKRYLVRRELGIEQDATVLLSVGELNDNKNHETVIKAIKDMEVYYIIAGTGDKRDILQRLIDGQGMGERIQLLGFRTDVCDLYAAADVFVFPSYREGLSVALMEAMASGLPCIVSKIRGNSDLIDDKNVLFDPYDIKNIKQVIQSILKRNLVPIGKHNAQIVKNFDMSVVLNDIKKIYNAIFSYDQVKS